MKNFLYFVLLIFSFTVYSSPIAIQPGAVQLNEYLPLLKNKRIGVFVNQTSMVNHQHLIDVLLRHHIHITKIFVPEHGFRGDAADGELIDNTMDPKTGIPIVSLYGKKLSPNSDDLSDVDVLMFDIQDVGVRFYTFISSLQKFMEAAIRNNKQLIILDRPNPNGFYVDGPVLDLEYKSFTGMQPIPIVYGMTIGEYAKMLVGEEWLDVKPKSLAKNLKLTIISCRNYTHQSLYVPPIKPSPNLPNIQAIYLYPTIGMLEATVISVGRGTHTPFQVYGHPLYQTSFSFIPTSRPEAKKPRYENQICYGWDLIADPKKTLNKINKKIQIKYILQAYQLFPDKIHFFTDFNHAAGNGILQKQIISDVSEAAIRQSWQPQLEKFKGIRKKYLMYPE